MKKLILLTIVAALLLCGCGGQTAPATEPTPTEVPFEPRNLLEILGKL